MNRRGHIGTVLLVLGALALVGVALFNMRDFNDDINGVRGEMRTVSSKVLAIHEANLDNIKNMVGESIKSSSNSSNFEESFNNSIRTLAELERGKGQNTDLYAKIALGDYFLDKDNQNYIMVVSEIFEQVEVQNNEGRYDYELHVIFNKTAVISVNVF